MPITTGRKALVAASATAISALGLLFAPAPAQAAPPCGQYGFPGRVDAREDHGAGDYIDVTFTSTGATASGPAKSQASKGDDTTGTISGGITSDGERSTSSIRRTAGAAPSTTPAPCAKAT
jgi:hypothetical protein